MSRPPFAIAQGDLFHLRFFKTLGEEGHRTSMPPSLQGLSLQSICNATDELPSMSQKTAKLSDAIGPVMTDGVLTF